MLAEIATTSLHEETFNCPQLLLPVATTVPSIFNPTVWFPPTAIDTIFSQDDTSHYLLVVFPQDTTVPSALNPTV